MSKAPGAERHTHLLPALEVLKEVHMLRLWGLDGGDRLVLLVLLALTLASLLPGLCATPLLAERRAFILLLDAAVRLGLQASSSTQNAQAMLLVLHASAIGGEQPAPTHSFFGAPLLHFLLKLRRLLILAHSLAVIMVPHVPA